MNNDWQPRGTPVALTSVYKCFICWQAYINVVQKFWHITYCQNFNLQLSTLKYSWRKGTSRKGIFHLVSEQVEIHPKFPVFSFSSVPFWALGGFMRQQIYWNGLFEPYMLYPHASTTVSRHCCLSLVSLSRDVLVQIYWRSRNVQFGKWSRLSDK